MVFVQSALETSIPKASSPLIPLLANLNAVFVDLNKHGISDTMVVTGEWTNCDDVAYHQQRRDRQGRCTESGELNPA